MNEIIYLENDEEITSVIDRLRKAKEKSLALVIPRGGSLAQSIVNLKLLKKSAGELGKEISLVSNDRISRNLASQIGLTVYSKASEAEKAKPVKEEPLPVAVPEGDFKVNSYYGKDDEVIAEGQKELEDSPEEDIEEDEDLDDIDDEIENEPTFTKVSDKSEKVEKEDIEKAYKEPQENPKSEIRNPKDGDHSIVGSDRKDHRDNKFGEPKEKKPMSRNKKIALGVIGGVVVLLLAVSYFFLPYAKANVMVKTEDLEVSESIKLDPQATAVDGTNLIIPATTVELEKEISKTYPTTGKKDQGTKATGKITISNLFNYDPATFPKGTRFISGDKVFVSLADVTVPGETVDLIQQKFIAGIADVLVESESAGANYNIGPSDFVIGGLTGLKLSRITGHSASAMIGGTTKTINIVSEADYKAAEADLTKSITELGKTELIAKAKEENLEIVESKIAAEVISKEASKNLNDEADNFDYRLKMKVSVIVYATEDMRTALVAAAEKNLASDKMLIGKDKFEVSAEFVKDVKPVDGGTATGELEMKGTMKAKTGQKISESEIKDKIKGKKYAEAKTIIEKYDRVESVTIDVWPSNVARVPYLTSRIKVIFDYAQ